MKLRKVEWKKSLPTLGVVNMMSLTTCSCCNQSLLLLFSSLRPFCCCCRPSAIARCFLAISRTKLIDFYFGMWCGSHSTHTRLRLVSHLFVSWNWFIPNFLKIKAITAISTVCACFFWTRTCCQEQSSF